MKDVAIILENQPGELAKMGKALGAAGISVEGGGGWVVDGRGIMHFLFEDDAAVTETLAAVGIQVEAEKPVLTQRLKQDVPGQLGMIASNMAAAGVNIEVMYSDHDHQLILVVDDHEKGKVVSQAWATNNL